MDKSITFRCSEELRKQVDGLAIQQSRPGNMVKPSTVVRQLVEKEMARIAKEVEKAA